MCTLLTASIPVLLLPRRVWSCCTAPPNGQRRSTRPHVALQLVSYWNGLMRCWNWLQSGHGSIRDVLKWADFGMLEWLIRYWNGLQSGHGSIHDMLKWAGEMLEWADEMLEWAGEMLELG